MSVLAIPPEVPKIPKARKSPKPRTPAASAAAPGFWQCPDCLYRIATDFPNGKRDAILAHELAHRYPRQIPLSDKTKAWILPEGDLERIFAGWSPEAKVAAVTGLQAGD